MNMHKIDGAEMLGILIRKLTENWETLCDEYLEEGEARPIFKVLPATQYIMWSRMNVIDNCKSISDKAVLIDDTILNGALETVCRQVDDMTLNGYPILDDVVIRCIDDDNYAAEYNKMYTILGEHLATMMVDVRVPELLLDYLYLYQKICIGRYLYEIRNVLTKDAVTAIDIVHKLALATLYSGDNMKIDKSDPLSRFNVVTYDRKAIEYVGVDIDQIRSVFKSYNETIEKSRTFYVTDEIYNS
jgi:hypothetical protein